jgi:hypothetical protein
MPEESAKTTRKKRTKAQNRTAWRKLRFLEKYGRYCLVGKAARATGINRSTVYLWEQKDKDFAERLEYARRDVVEMLEAEAIRRGMKGILKPVLIVLLKANAPEKYRERHEISGPKGGPIKHDAVTTFKFIMPDGTEKTAAEMLINSVKQ